MKSQTIEAVLGVLSVFVAVALACRGDVGTVPEADPATPTAAAIVRPSEGRDTFAATAIRVIDGDTFACDLTARIDGRVSVLFADERVRLLGIDAPEVTGHSRERGDESRKALASLLATGPVEVRTSERDNFGRRLASVYAGPVGDGRVFVNDRMVSLGFARAWDGGRRKVPVEVER